MSAIFGIGTDLVEISRIEASFERFGDRFVRHLLMDEELERFTSTKQPARFLAMRFAAKEALVKALGTGFRPGIWLRDVGYVPDSKGRPQVCFSERGTELCTSMGAGAAQVSLTDEAGLIVAFALFENTN